MPATACGNPINYCLNWENLHQLWAAAPVLVLYKKKLPREFMVW